MRRHARHSVDWHGTESNFSLVGGQSFNGNYLDVEFWPRVERLVNAEAVIDVFFEAVEVGQAVGNGHFRTLTASGQYRQASGPLP